MKAISQMTQEEKLQTISEYTPCRIEREIVLRYLLAVRRNDIQQIEYFEKFGKSIRQIILNVHTYEKSIAFRLYKQGFKRTRLVNRYVTHR